MTRIKLNDLDPSFKHRIAALPGGQGIKACFACKACTAACPIKGVESRYDPRKIIRAALLGMTKEVLESEFIWLCSSCYGCKEVCTQDVDFTEVIYAIKNLAALEAAIPAGLSAQRTLMKAHGRLYEVTEFENDKRKKMGLPPIQEDAAHYDALL